MFRIPEWTEWLSAKGRCLWLHGIPGAGKTVLMSYLIEHIREHCKNIAYGKCVYVFYYCYFVRNQDETAPFLRWLIGQLCRQAHSTPVYLYELYGRGREASTKELLKAVEKTLACFDTTYVALDALNERQCWGNMLDVLRALATQPRFRTLQLLVSSREYIDIEKAMQQRSISVSMANLAVEDDIRCYVRSAVKSKGKFKG